MPDCHSLISDLAAQSCDDYVWKWSDSVKSYAHSGKASTCQSTLSKGPVSSVSEVQCHGGCALSTGPALPPTSCVANLHGAPRRLCRPPSPCSLLQCHGGCCTDDGTCPSSSCVTNLLGQDDSGAQCNFDGRTTTSGRSVNRPQCMTDSDA